MKKLIPILLFLLIAAAALPSILLAETDTTKFALIAISPEKTVSGCVTTNNQTILSALQDNGFSPKQDDTGFIYSLIGHDGPLSSDPAAKQAFWGFWKGGKDQLNFSEFGPQTVRAQSGNKYVLAFGNGTLSQDIPSFDSVCPPSNPVNPPPTPSPGNSTDFNKQAAINYLRNNFNNVASNTQDWVALALGSQNETSQTGQSTSTEPTSLARIILAKAAQGQDRTSQLNALKNTYHDNQFGSASLINDDIFGVLAIQSSDSSWLSSHAGVFTSIAQSQRSNGSFGFEKTGDGDVDMTSAALWALKYAPVDQSTIINKAFDYLGSAKKADGSFGINKTSNSNIPSTSWALIAYTTYKKDGSATINYLEKNQQSNGAWLYGGQPDVTSSAYAVLALSLKPLPIIKGSTTPLTNPHASNQSSNPSNSTSTSSALANTSVKTRTSGYYSRNQKTYPVREQQSSYLYTCSASASASASASGSSASASSSASATCY